MLVLTNVLLTGVTGFVGRNLLKRLIDLGYNVRCVVRDHHSLIDIKKLKLNAEFVLGDVTNRDSIRGYMHNIDVIFHLAIMVSVSDCLENPVKAFNTNTLGTLNLLEEIRTDIFRTRKKKIFIYLSSDRVYGKSASNIVTEEYTTNPTDPYSISKLSSEFLIKTYNVCYKNPYYTILRSANIYGYSQSKNFFIPSLINQILSGKRRIGVGNMNCYRNFIYIDDLINALMLVLEKRNKCKNQVFNLSESCVQMKYVTRLISKFAVSYLNRKVKFYRNRHLLRPNEIEFDKFELDCSKIMKIGWKPKYKFEKGLRKTFEAYLNKNA